MEICKMISAASEDAVFDIRGEEAKVHFAYGIFSKMKSNQLKNQIDAAGCRTFDIS